MATSQKNLSSYEAENLPDAKDFRIGLVVSEWNGEITGAMYRGAVDTLKKHSVGEANLIRRDVPGSFELIYGCSRMQQTHGTLDAIIAIGSVIRGETAHFDYVCQAVSQGIKDLNLTGEIPVIFCVLTDDTRQQALDRSGGKHGNKGVEAAIAALKMAGMKNS